MDCRAVVDDLIRMEGMSLMEGMAWAARGSLSPHAGFVAPKHDLHVESMRRV